MVTGTLTNPPSPDAAGAAALAAAAAGAAAAATAAQVETAPDAFMPVPDTFDAAPSASDDLGAPVFRDVDFGEEDEDDDEEDFSPIEITEKNGKRIATYVFDDTDFWVTDNDHWFATGKQIESPIRLLLDADADKRVLVLESRNIMDLESLIPIWESKGIIIN